jgi:hypothetical protein
MIKRRSFVTMDFGVKSLKINTGADVEAFTYFCSFYLTLLLSHIGSPIRHC